MTVCYNEACEKLIKDGGSPLGSLVRGPRTRGFDGCGHEAFVRIAYFQKETNKRTKNQYHTLRPPEYARSFVLCGECVL